MIKKEKGFIATSLLYSFFLVFLALILIIINSYISNKLISVRYNEEIIKQLNNKTFNIKIIGKNVIIFNGINIINIINDSSFDEIGTYWKNNNANITKENGLLKISGENNTYLYQTIYCSSFDTSCISGFYSGHKYYLSLEYKQNHDIQLETYFHGQTSNVIKTKKSADFVKAGTIFKSNDELSRVYLMHNKSNTSIPESNPTYIKNVMLIDLTETFGEGNEPELDYLLNNIEYFDSSVYYITKEWKTGDDIVSIGTKAFGSVNNVTYECKDSANVTYTPDFEEKDDVKYLIFNNLKDNVKCYINGELSS